MTDSNSGFSKLFPNPFSDKKEEDKAKDIPAQIEEVKIEIEDQKEGIHVEEEGNGVIQHLIYHSFYPLTCMVPLGEGFIRINENIPDMMKATSNDALLQEAVKTFQVLLQEKEDEILNLRRQLKDEDTTLVKMMSTSIQTDLTLSACDEMERQLIELSEGLPEKVERIHQLELEKAKLEECNKVALAGDEPSKISQLEEELSESLKTSVELEEGNLTLSKEIKDLKQNYLELTWQLEEMNDLKVEVELAKIQTEENMLKLKETFKDKDILIGRLKDQLKNIDELDGEGRGNVVVGTISVLEFETMQKNHIKEMEELEQCLKDEQEKNEQKSEKLDNDLELTELIEKVKDRILYTSASPRIVTSIVQVLPHYAERLGPSDIETVNELVAISLDPEISEGDTRIIAAVLGAIEYQENGEIDGNSFYDSYKNNLRTREIEGKGKDSLQQEALSLGVMLKVKDSLFRTNLENVKKEFTKLETILNILNRSYKRTHLSEVNKMSQRGIIEAVMRLKSTIYEICMHTFWENIFHQSIKAKDAHGTLLVSDDDRKVFHSLLFPSFDNREVFRDFLQSLVNVKEVLLLGEVSSVSIKMGSIETMKLSGVNVYQDVCGHILPKFPKETRYNLMGRSIADIVSGESKLLSNISPDFTSSLNDSNVPEALFNILLALNFEEEIYSTSTKTSSFEFKISKLAISSLTNKTENSLIKTYLKKDIRVTILNKIEELDKVLLTTEEKGLVESYKQKSEKELTKILIEKKENTLKILFKSSFRPVVEKLTLGKGSSHLSCTSKELIGLDFWGKLLLDKYRQKQLIQLKDLTVEELEICFNRLQQAMKIIFPSYVTSMVETKNSKATMAPLIFRYRNTLKTHVDQCLFRRVSNIDEVGKGDRRDLEEIFQCPEKEKRKLEDVLQRLYDIDCEICPGEFDQEMEKKVFTSIPDCVIFEEIVKLRLSIASYVVSPQQSSESSSDTADQLNHFKTLKEIESILMKTEPELVDDNLVSSETKLLKIIVGNLKKKNTKIDEQKLKSGFLAMTKVECGLRNEKFDSGKTTIEFDKITDKKVRVRLMLEKTESLLNIMKLKSTSKESSDKLVENYAHVEELLGDIEAKMPTMNGKVKKIWSFIVHDKTVEILKLITHKEHYQSSLESSIKERVLHNLDDIKLWALEVSDWNKVCFNRLNNLIKKLNSRVGNRSIKMSLSDNSEMTGTFQDEKAAFEKAFGQLEDRFKDLEGTDKGTDGKLELASKTDDELRNIILALEKEISQGKWTRSEEADVESWLGSRKREDLISDCNDLVYKSLSMKIDGLLASTSEKETRNERPTRENKISQFEDDINAKLAKYEELCDTVEKMKIPQRKNDPRSTVSPSDSINRRRVEMDSSYGPQSNGRKLSSPVIRGSASQAHLLQEDDDIDSYFQQRMEELQKVINFPNTSTIQRGYAHSGSSILVDGFDIENEKTARYYSMKLQDIQHERREDDMGALIHDIEKHRAILLAENEALKQQLCVCKTVQDNQSLRVASLEKTDDILRQRLAALESDTSAGVEKDSILQEMEAMRLERQRLTSSLGKMQKRMDLLNSETLSLSSANEELQHEKHNLFIKNQFLERSIHKLEEVYSDLVQQLESCKTHQDRSRSDNYPEDGQPNPDRDIEKKLRINEKQMIELVKKLDLLDEKNKLYEKYCEKSNGEISLLTKKFAEEKQKCQMLTDLLDKSKLDKHQMDSSTASRNKDDEIKHLKNKILHLETRLVSSRESPSGDRLKQELITNKDKEIMRLADQIGSLQDRVDEIRAQMEVKDYENRKLQSLTKQLQNQVNKGSYFPPPGNKIVKDS